MRRVAVAALLLLAACERPITGVDRSLLVTTTVTPSIVRIGQPASVQLVIVNRGRSTVSINPYSGWCESAIELLNSDGTSPFDDEICAGVGHDPVVLAPGDRFTLMQQWATRSVGEGRFTVRGALTGPSVENVSATLEITP